jgi:hypothetical protein
MALRRYRFLGFSNSQLQRLIGNFPSYTAAGNQPVFDFEIPTGFEADADSYLASEGWQLLSAAPVGAPQDAAAGLADALPWCRSVDVWTDANVALTGLIVVDGVTTTAGMRVMCSGQTVVSENGVYIAAATAWVRAEDALLSASFAGRQYYVLRGVQHVRKRLRCTNLPGADGIGAAAITMEAATGARVTSGPFGNLKLEDNSTTNGFPVSPVEGQGIVLYNRVRRSNRELSVLSAEHRSYEVQGALGDKAVEIIRPRAGAVTLDLLGVTPIITGTATLRTPAITNLATQLKRVGIVSAAAAGSSAGIRTGIPAYLLSGGNVPANGFKFRARFTLSAMNATARWFVGVITAPAVIANVNPSTLVNMVGYGCDSGQTTVRLLQCGAANPANFVATDQGVNFPAVTTDQVYDVTIVATPPTGKISVSILNVNTGIVNDDIISSNFPAAQFVTWQYWVNNGTTATAVALDLVSHYMETDA